MAVDIKDWAKSPEGIQTIEDQRVFCIGSHLWQGFKGVAIRVVESQLEHEELENVPDFDGTIKDVWFTRRQRIEARYERKTKEYDERRALLRTERNKIRDSVRQDKELGLPTSDDDLNELNRIYDRMKRLTNLREEQELQSARQRELGNAPAPPADVETAVVPPSKEYACDICGETPPVGKNPDRWLRGHVVGAHRNPRKKAEVA